jgi:hypothetical protein
LSMARLAARPPVAAAVVSIIPGFGSSPLPRQKAGGNP